MPSTEGPNDATTSGFSRRHFLVGAGVLGASSWLLRAGPDLPNALERVAARPGPRASIGYVAGGDGGTLAEVLATGGARAVPAALLAAGDSSLRRDGARVQVLGLSPGHDPDAPGAVHHAYLDALTAPQASNVSGETMPYFAWTMRDGVSVSSPTAFAVPVTSRPTLGFALEARGATVDAAAPPAGPATAVLTGGRQSGLAKLREGLYLIGLRPGVWDRELALPAVGDAAWADLASLVLRVSPA